MGRFGKSIFILIALLSLLAACTNSSQPQNTQASITVEPRESLSPSPTIYLTPSPTGLEPTQTILPPSPIPAIKLWVDPYLPSELNQLIHSKIEAQGTISQIAEIDAADGIIQVSDQNVVSRWVYVLVAPFPTLIDGVSFEDLFSIWSGIGSSTAFSQHLLMDESTRSAFAYLWGETSSAAIEVLPQGDILRYAWENQPALALIPFEELEPRWKVLEVDGQSPIHKDFDPSSYPLIIPIGLTGNQDLFGYAVIKSLHLPGSNRDPEKLTTLSLTGVTALVRGTALTMERLGITYPAMDISDILRSSDLTHVNNEIPFTPDCPFPELYPTSLTFCSNPAYIELLEAIGTDIVELSGDHFADYGHDAMINTLQLYDERGWQVYGGGENEERAREPVLIEHNGNRIAILGCNIGCEIKTEISCKALAQGDRPGAAACDFEWLDGEIKQLKEQGYTVVFTFQHKEYYTYSAQPDLIRDFGRVANAGAAIVSGSQSHQPHGLTFEEGAFIHYGLGNLFFDQYNYCADYACNNGFIDRHVFYDNHYISTELITIRFVDMARPRLMTAEERTKFLKLIFQASGW